LGDDGAVEDESSRLDGGAAGEHGAVGAPAAAGDGGPAPWAAPDRAGDTTGAWAAPGAAVEQPIPGPTEAGAPGADVPSGRVVREPTADDAGGGVPAITLRPMTVADVLDGGFAVVKARPRRILGLTAAFVIPTQLTVALLQRGAYESSGIVEWFSTDPTVTNEPVSGGDLAAQWIALAISVVVPAIALVCVAAAIGHLVGQWIMGRDAPAGEMARIIATRWWPLLGSFVVVKLAEAASIFGCYLGLLFVLPLFVVVAPVIGVEGGGGMNAIGRSVRLVRPRYFPVMGIALLMALVSSLLGTALSALPQALVAWDGDWWPLLTVGAIASEIVVMPFVAAATVLLYFDLRVRTEGLDLEMAAGRVFDRAA
jgi:hypothetical protein